MDTRSKRASSVGLWKPYVMALVLPDGAISQGDRQHSAWDYSGILAAIPIPPTPPVVVIPTQRLYNVPFEDRVLGILLEDRVLETPFEDRVFEVRPE
jgi:hypothetical protein